MKFRKKEFVFSCVTLFCLWNSACDQLITPKGDNPDVEALIGIKSFLVDPNGVLGWDEDAVDPCSWRTVTCSPDGLVIGLEATSRNLSGTLAPTIGDLANLQSVLLQDNNISGRIPFELGKLTKLKRLDLSNNHFSGQVPSILTHLKSLQYLKLNNNDLSGEIPASLANLTQLILIDLSFNNLSGYVPTFPAKVFINTDGNPYICSNGTEKVGCADMDTAVLPGSSKAKLNNLSGIYRSGMFYVILAYWLLIS